MLHLSSGMLTSAPDVAPSARVAPAAHPAPALPFVRLPRDEWVRAMAQSVGDYDGRLHNDRLLAVRQSQPAHALHLIEALSFMQWGHC